MKKFITLLLVLALLVPMCLVANADTAKKSFYAVTWSNEIDGLSNVDNLVNINIEMLGENVRFGSLIYSQYTDEQVESMAKSLKAKMDGRVEGQRYIHFFGPANTMALVEKSVYFDAAVTQLSEMADKLFAKYKEIGGEVDGAMMSMLYPDMGSHYVKTSEYNRIVKDERYATQIRPLLEERGFVFYENPTPQTPEIYGISGKAGSKYSNCAAIWNTVMGIRLNTGIRQWAYEPMAKYFPDVHVADYQSTDTDAWMKPMTQSGSVTGGGGNALRAGNTSCEKFYSNTPSNDDFYNNIGTSYKNIPTYMNATYKKTAFNNFRYDMNVAKQVYIADANNDVCFWISKYGTTDNNTSVAGSPYYAEQLYHLCMYDPKPFVAFFNTADVKGEQLQRCAGIVNELLLEMDRVLGYADRKPIETPVDWNSEFVISGMYANGKNIWRITPNRDLTSKEAFKVKGSDPTFSLNGQTVTFPGGKIIEDTTISEVGTMGYWVETSSKTNPVITSDANRFEKYPAYTENFESYAPNTNLTTTNVRDLNAWIINPKGSDVLVSNNGANKALSLTGNSLLQNKLVPANITIGDVYAKQQSWQLTITIPEGLNKDASMVLLNYEASGTDFDDGGFKLQGGKLYYAVGKEDEAYEPVYAELLDVKPGTYTLRRDMNFGQSFFCNYTVMDENGKELKSVKNVVIPAFSGKVSSIDVTCYELNKRVLLDDYTLRVTGATADLYLYDTRLGTKVADGAKHSASVTYRLSWANASGKNETATVKAEIGGAVKSLKTITMKPGYTGVEYGTVDVKSGQSVKVYLESSIQDVKLEENTATAPTQDASDTKATEATTKLTKPTKAPKDPIKATTVSKATKATAPTAATKPAATVQVEILEDGLKEVPQALISVGLDTVNKVKDALAQTLQKADGNVTAENIAHYDIRMNKEALPEDGRISVVLPYPAGTDATYKFSVAQIYISKDYGKIPGQVELHEVTNTEDGIVFDMIGPAPICVSWISPEDIPAIDPSESPDQTPGNTTAKPTINSTMIWTIVIAVVVMAAAAGVATWFVLKKKPAAPVEAAEDADATEAAEVAEATEATEAVEATETAETAETAEATEETETPEEKTEE